MFDTTTGEPIPRVPLHGPEARRRAERAAAEGPAPQRPLDEDEQRAVARLRAEAEAHERWLEATDEARADGSLYAWRRW